MGKILFLWIFGFQLIIVAISENSAKEQKKQGKYEDYDEDNCSNKIVSIEEYHYISRSDLFTSII